MTAPITSNTLGVNVFTAPGKAMVGERPKPFGEALGFDPMMATLIFGEHDAVLVDAMTTVAEAEALADWVALHNRNLETIYITHAHFDHFYGLSILLDRFPGARAIATPQTVNAMQMSFTPPVERLARRLFPGQVPTKLVPHVCRRHHPGEPKELDRGPGPVSRAEPEDCCRRSQKAWRARFSRVDPGNQALPSGLRSGAESRDVRPRPVRSDDGAVPGLGSQSVVVDVWIPGGITH